MSHKKSSKFKFIIFTFILLFCTTGYLFVPVNALHIYNYRFVERKNETWIPINSSFHFKLRLWAVTPNRYIGENLTEMGITEDNMMDGTWMVAMQSGLCYEDYINKKKHLVYNNDANDRYQSANVIETAFQYNTPNPYYNASFNDSYSFNFEQYDEIAFFQTNTTLMNLPNTHINRKMPSFTYEQWIKRQYITFCYNVEGLDKFDDSLAYNPAYIEIIKNNIKNEYIGSEEEKQEFINGIDYEARKRAYAYSQVDPYKNTKMYADGGVPNKDWVVPYSYDDQYMETILPRNQYLMNDSDINRNKASDDFGYFVGGNYTYYGGDYGIWENSEILEFTSPRLKEGYYSFLIQIAEFNEEGIFEGPKLNLVIWVNVTNEPKPFDAYIWDIIAVCLVLFIIYIIYDMIPRIKRAFEVKKLDERIMKDKENPSICYGGEQECFVDNFKRPLIAIPGTKPCICVLDTQENRKRYYTDTVFKQEKKQNKKNT